MTSLSMKLKFELLQGNSRKPRPYITSTSDEQYHPQVAIGYRIPPLLSFYIVHQEHFLPLPVGGIGIGITQRLLRLSFGRVGLRSIESRSQYFDFVLTTVYNVS